jgi:hypothetical protein
LDQPLKPQLKGRREVILFDKKKNKSSLRKEVGEGGTGLHVAVVETP